MKIKKETFARIVREELSRTLRMLREADEKDEKEGHPKIPTEPKQAASKAPPKGEEPPPEEVPDPADEVDAAEEKGDEPGGEVNKEVSGKTVQSVAMDPKSKILPGATDIVVSFNETTDALHILVTKTGQVKYSYKGQLFDMP